MVETNAANPAQRTEMEQQLNCTAQRMLAARYGCKWCASGPPSLSLGR
jgi:hypothetical protein